MVLFALFFRIEWKVFTYKPVSTRAIIKEFLEFTTVAAHRRIKWLSACLVTYFLLVSATGLCCWFYEARNIRAPGGMIPVIIIVYCAGLMLTARLFAERKKFTNYLHLIDKKLVK